MRHTIRSTLRVVVLLSVFLGGCFSSEKPLLAEEDAVTPLPDTFTLVKIDELGKVKTDAKGQADLSEFTRSGKTYVHQAFGTLTLAELDHSAGLFLVQDVMSMPDPQKGETHIVTYYLAAILNNKLLKVSPPNPGKTGLDAALKNAGVCDGPGCLDSFRGEIS
jgi:hypothetical protein